MKWFASPRRSFNSINRKNRQRLGRAASAVASSALQRAENLESRRLLTTYTGTANADTFLVQVGGGNVTVTVNGVPNIQSDAVVTTIVIDALGGNDTITVINNTNNPTTINAGDGDDTIVVGGGDYDTNIASTVVVTDGTGTNDSLTFDDTADGAGSDTYTMTADRTLQKGASVATTTWAGMNSVVVNGSNQTNTWNVDTNNGSGTVTLNGGTLVDTFNIGDAVVDLQNNIDTTLVVNGNAGADVVTIDDTAETSAVNYSLDAQGLTSNLIGASVRIGFQSISSGTLNSAVGAIAHSYTILDLNGITSTTINAGDGNDTLNYGDGVADINTIDVAITFNGQAGTDRLNYNSQATAIASTKTVTSTTIDSPQHGILTHGAMESLVMNLSGLAETVTFNSTPLTALTTLNAGDGNDTIQIGAGNFVSTVDENVTVNGGGGTDSLLIDDSANTLARTWTITGGSANASADIVSWSTLASDAVELVSLLGGTGNDTFNKTASNSNSAMTVNGGDGNDTLNAGSAGSLGVWPGTVVYTGGVGTDSLLIDDSTANTASQVYTFTDDINTVFSRTGANGSIGFNSTTEAVTLNTGTGGAATLAQTINVNGAPAGTAGSTLLVNAGDGNDTVNVGGGDWGQEIDRAVSINGGTGTDRLQINDSVNPDSDTYTLNVGSMTSADASVASISWDTNVTNIELSGSGFADNFVVSAMRGADFVTLRGGAGNDTLGAGTNPGDIDNTFTGSVFFAGDADVDSIVLADAEGVDGGENYTITGGAFSKSAGTFGALTYNGNTEVLNYSLDDDSSLVTIAGLNDGQSLTVNAGAGNDTIQNDASNNFSVEWEDATLSLSGGSGTDVLDLDDSISAAPNYFIDGNVISTLAFSVTGPMSAVYDLFENITILAGSAASTINWVGADGSTNFTLNGGDGDDTINVGGATGSDLNDGVGFTLVTGTISIQGGAGTDSLHFRDADNELGDDVYELTQTQFIVGAGGADPVAFSYSSDVDRLAINGSNLASTYNVNSTFSTIPTTLSGGDLGDNIRLAQSTNDLDNVDASLTIVGGAGNDSLTLQDTANVGAATWTINNNTINRGGLFGPLSYNTLELVTINASVEGDTFNINSLAAATDYVINAGDGNDVYNVGGVAPGNTNSVDGDATLFGGGGTDTVNYNDQNNAAVTTYTLQSSGVDTDILRTGAGTVEVGNFVENLFVNTGSAANTINVNSLPNQPTATSIVAGIGNDTINVGNGDFDSNVLRSVSINAGGGTDSLVFNDALDNDTGDTYTLTSFSIVDSGVAAVNLFYNQGSNTEFLTMNLPGGAETVNVQSSISGTTVINGGAGNDTVNAGNGDLDSLNGSLTVNGDAGDDRFNLDNTAALTNGTINFDAVSPTLGRITNIDAAPDDVAFFGNTTEFVVLNDGSGNTTFNVNSLPNSSGVSILGGLGNDTVNAGGGDIDQNLAAGTNIPSFNGGGGTDVLNFNDTTDDAGSDNMTVLNNQVRKGGQFVNYTLFESMNIAGSPQATNYTVESINAATPTSIAGGGAADTFVVGNDIDLGLLGATTITGGGGVDSMTLNDTGDAADADTYTFTDAGALDTFTKTGSALLSFNVENVVLDANAGNNPIVVNSMSINSLTLNGNSGNDNIQLADGGTSANPVLVSSGAGIDTVQVDSDNDAVEAVARFTGTDEVASIIVRAGSQLRNGPGNSTTIITGPAASVIAGSFDVGSGFLIARVGVASLGAWNSVVASGYNGGAWNGAAGAVNSSAAAASARSDGVGIRLATDPNLPGANVITFGGQAVNPGDVLMGYVQNGDTDLDRDVDFDDLLRVAQNYNLAAPRVWTQGSFDYDNDVDFDDLLSTAQNYGLPFLRVNTTAADTAAASDAFSVASQQRGLPLRASRALASVRDALDREETVFARDRVIA